ncbi:UTP--glucose-1-phosphate uridylyltransferase [Frigoriglobus tundricola]|uniref:N-acetylglucosamine-1-phosphate uridyltransferase eukaryotic n=1 Tax=Frigoriglobus tundricola TaxID=2774151 RepID=A0A6M5YIH0_9BACT|nr:UDPGP type 1 family protein [Frigoriglobus tundricola]QJW93825.1 N-acetylglucosamine-1-phosphate uridyltransferase eukaryotic [Frigoriglobus tundricola]
MTSPPPHLQDRLSKFGQEHVLRGWDALDADTRTRLVQHLSAIDFAELDALRHQATKPPESVPADIRPVPITPAAFTAEETARGAEALRRGAVAALLVAGGQGSRLGVLKPKGTFPAGAVSGAPLYQIHAEKVLALSRRAGRPVPFLVMTSPATDTDTRAFFAEHANFGLRAEQVRFFQQGTMPAVCPHSGRLLLEAPGKLFLSPNGHGGTLTALADSGVLADLVSHGVEHVFYFQVDNPLVKVCDPGFIGRHIGTGSEASSKVVAKTEPGEKVGVLVATNGRCGIIEYTLLPKHLAEQREPTGELSFRAGSPAIHVFSVPFLERVTRTAAGSLPYRTALKAVSHYDPHRGETVAAVGKEPNAVKFERFIFDALPHAERWLAVETPRAEEFAPIKNATGPDSPDTSRAAQVALHAQWLKRAGVETHGHPVEVSPLFALDADELAARIPAGTTITEPTVLK